MSDGYHKKTYRSLLRLLSLEQDLGAIGNLKMVSSKASPLATSLNHLGPDLGAIGMER